MDPSLLQGVGLCHGISGNGYAMLALARATKDPLWLSAAQQFGTYGARQWEALYDVPDRPASLFEVRRLPT
jgi:lantibiotic modifying enzyme